MKTEKINLTKLFKIGILLFGISLLLWNCEKEDDNFGNLKTTQTNNNYLQKLSYEDLKFDHSFKKVAKSFKVDFLINEDDIINKRKGIENNFTIETNKIYKIEKDNYKSFTFYINRDNTPDNIVENLVIEQKGDSIRGFFIKYRYSENYLTEYLNNRNTPFDGDIQVSMKTKKIDDLIKSITKKTSSNSQAKMLFCYYVNVTINVPCNGTNKHSVDDRTCPLIGTPGEAFQYTDRKKVCEYGSSDGGLSSWSSDGYESDTNTSDSGGTITNNDSSTTINTSCGFQGCTRVANKLASSLNLTENERLWLSNGENDILIETLDKFLFDNNNSIKAKIFGKNAIKILSLDELTINNNIDTFRNRILEITTNLKQWGNPEDEIFAEYVESLVQDFHLMTVGDVYDIYKMTDKQSKILIWKYAAAVIVPIAETAYPFIVYAVTEASLGAALPLLSRIPLAMVTRGVKLEKMIEKTMKLGVQGNKPHIKIFKTYLNPERIAKEMFNSLTKGRIGNIVEVAPNVFQANMGSGNFIIYRTASKTGFEATLEFNFSKFLVNGRPSILKFTK
ncbi:hypothetical protein [uncultured Polaribacter sp.]|uniref:hypothetical protein n=1 Tax=uncultured Polaribacter sp. TaxID=174711 RepID=UPI002632AE4F|nr:hypothetical protein [uncultured Polaribacter sp.]